MSTEQEPSPLAVAWENSQAVDALRNPPTYEITIFTAMAVFGFVGFTTAYLGMTPQEAAWFAENYPGIRVTYQTRPPFWKAQALAGQLVFLAGALGDVAHFFATQEPDE